MLLNSSESPSFITRRSQQRAAAAAASQTFSAPSFFAACAKQSVPFAVCLPEVSRQAVR